MNYYLTLRQVTELEQQLVKRREILIRELALNQQNTGAPAPDPVGEVQDPGEESTADAEAMLNDAISGQREAGLQAIDEALLRIEADIYGSCLECGDPIGIERLRAWPVALQCVECKALNETRSLYAVHDPGRPPHKY